MLDESKIGAYSHVNPILYSILSIQDALFSASEHVIWGYKTIQRETGRLLSTGPTFRIVRLSLLRSSMRRMLDISFAIPIYPQ